MSGLDMFRLRNQLLTYRYLSSIETSSADITPGTGIGHSGWRVSSTSMIFSTIPVARRRRLVPSGSRWTTERRRRSRGSCRDRDGSAPPAGPGRPRPDRPYSRLASSRSSRDGSRRPYLRWPTSSRSKPGMKVFGAAHCARDHDVVARLVPEVVVERHRPGPGRVLHRPTISNSLSRCRNPPEPLPWRRREHGDDDVGTKAMHGVRRRQVGLSLISAPSITVWSRGARVGRGVDDVDVVGPDAREQQVLAGHRRIVVTGRTRIPPGVMQFVTDPRHFQPMDDLRVGRLCGSASSVAR